MAGKEAVDETWVSNASHIYFHSSLIMILSFHVDTIALVNLSSSCPPRTDIPSLLVSAATALIAVLRFLQSKQTIYSFIYKKRGKIGVVFFFLFFYMHYVRTILAAKLAGPLLHCNLPSLSIFPVSQRCTPYSILIIPSAATSLSLTDCVHIYM